MAGKLITLPLRVSFRSARLLTQVAGTTASGALALAGRTVGALAPSRPSPPMTAPAPAPPPRKAPSVRAAPPVPPPRPERAPEESPMAPPQTSIHVSEEPELVREVAEPGAENGAGAAIHVAEPWNGYGRMSAKDVIARAKSANRAQLAAVRLYEARHRSRQTVLAAVDRQLKLSNGSAPA
jgi:hypothetical protein